MAEENLLSVEEYMALPYRMEIYKDDDYWAAEFPDLPGLVAGHETWEGLQDAIEDAKRAYFEAAIEDGRPIARPSVRREEFSGKLVIRLPKSMHRQAARAAEREGVSLNSFITAALAKELGAVEEQARSAAQLMMARLGHRASSFTAQTGHRAEEEELEYFANQPDLRKLPQYRIVGENQSGALAETRGER